VLNGRSGLYSDAKFTESLNAAIDAYWEQDHRDLSNAELAAYWATNDDRAFMSYTRGELIALILNERLVDITQGEADLDDLMRSLAHAAVDQGITQPTQAHLYDWIAQTGGEALAAEIRALVDTGGPLTLPRRVSAPSLVLDPETQRYQPAPG